MRILVTGCTGFIGSGLIKVLNGVNGFSVIGASRNHVADSEFEVNAVGEINALTNWSVCLSNVDVIVHTAARTHIIHETFDDPLGEFRRTNVDGTLNLARQAKSAGVSRFIFISSIGVNGFETRSGRSFSESDAPNPHDTYALSKWEAEQCLLNISIETGLEVVIIRPPLVYGADAPGNFGTLMGILRRGLPLPLGSLQNKRSLISLGNLLDFISICLTHPAAANQTFLVSDDHDLSTSELIKNTASALGVRPILFRCPLFIIQFFAKVLGKRRAAQRLCGDLQVDISKARHMLGWSPPFSIEDGFKRVSSNIQGSNNFYR